MEWDNDKMSFASRVDVGMSNSRQLVIGYNDLRILLQVMAKRLGTGAIFRPKFGRYQWFTKLVSGHGVNDWP